MAVKKSKIFLTIISIVLLVTVIILTYYSYARYTSAATGSAKIYGATWSVSSTSNDSSLSLVAGTTTATYTLTVNNASEVIVKYSIKLSNLPNDIEVKLDNGSYITPVNNEITFSNVGELGYSGTTTRNHTLTINSTQSTNEISNQNIGIDVIFEQK